MKSHVIYYLGIAFCVLQCAEVDPPSGRNGLKLAPLLSQPLREIATQNDLEVGVAFDGWQFDDSLWREHVTGEFNLATVQWGMYWRNIEPQQGQFNFNTVDRQVQLAIDNNMKIRGHALVFPETYPDWLVDGSFTDAELLEILRNHIQTIVTRYKGVISQWVVVNETYLDYYREDDIFYDRFGLDYIKDAFRFAREADSSAVLLYTDTDNHIMGSETYELTRQIVELLRDEQLIDGIGMHMHLDYDDLPTPEMLTSTINSYDVDVYVTEFDLDMRTYSGSKHLKFHDQANVYRDMYAATLATDNCRSFTVWQIGDRYSWLEHPPQPPFTSFEADPTMYDDNLLPKPAYYAILLVLENLMYDKYR